MADAEHEVKMTREEAVKLLKSKMDGHTDTSYEWSETIRMAIEALEQDGDCVNRQAVEEMIKAEMPDRGLWEIDGDKEKETVCEVCVDLMQKLSELPSVTLQPCEDVISRNSVIDILQKYMLGESKIAEEVSNLQPVTPYQNTGHWIPLGNYDDYGYESSYKCSECGDLDTYPDDYCPGCGAKNEVKE